MTTIPCTRKGMILFIIPYIILGHPIKMGNKPKNRQALFTVCYPGDIIIKTSGDTLINVSRETLITNSCYKRFFALKIFKTYRSMLKEVPEIRYNQTVTL